MGLLALGGQAELLGSPVGVGGGAQSCLLPSCSECSCTALHHPLGRLTQGSPRGLAQVKSPDPLGVETTLQGTLDSREMLPAPPTHTHPGPPCSP